VTNTRKHAFATVVALAAALGAGSALAMAESNQGVYGSNTSAQSATTEGSREALPLQAVDASRAMAPQVNAPEDDDSRYVADEAAGGDDSDTSAVNSVGSDTDSDMATQPSAAPAYGADTPSTATVEGPATAPSEPAATEPAPVYESVPAYIAPPNSPRYTPETGDAEYGSKLDPVGPQSNRFNDATGQ
jgi:hypothetical protein